MKKTVEITGMACNGCANNVKSRFEKIPGVDAVTVDLEAKEASLTSQTDISIDSLNAALDGTKYAVSTEK